MQSATEIIQDNPNETNLLLACHAQICIEKRYQKNKQSIKDALHIQLTLEQQCFNGLELPDSWVATLKALTKKLHTPPPPHRR